MLRLSKLTDYATVILSYIAKENSRVCAAMEIATETGIALPTVSKILKLLAHANVLISTRGAKGGYALSRSSETITLAEVITALEGPIALTECSGNTEHTCTQVIDCKMGNNWSLINQSIQNALAAVTLKDLIAPVPTPAIQQEIKIPLASIHR